MLQSVMTLAGASALAAPALAGPINAMCPIGKEPVVHSVGTVEHNGETIGLCCPGCGEAFLAWDEDRKDAFVASAMSVNSAPTVIGDVRQYGAMREVMRDGADEPRVGLDQFAGRPGVVAVGALAGLEGEVVILDGEVWASRGAGGDVAAVRAAEEHATLLTVAEAGEWTIESIDAGGLSLDELLRREIDGDGPTPFVLEADVAELSLHVINGFCPKGVDPGERGVEPWRWSGTASGGVTIVGFHAPGTAGVMTHHGSEAHAHALVEIDGRRVAAHVDGARVLGAAALRTPKDTEPADEAEASGARVVRGEDAAALGGQLVHYPLEDCLVSGQPLGSMGEPVDMLVDGRLVRLCCAGCIGALEADPDAAIEKLNAGIVERQAERYPLGNCMISGAELGSMGEPLNVFHENRLARLCCAGCLDAFNADPGAAMAKIDTAYADAQRDGYPLGSCVVSGAELGSMGEPVELVAGTRLVRFCCAACVPKFKASPRTYLSKIPRE